eukprot:CAMPEP_0118896358 /NCGR_PEP_ID=MMETSP1166-20130328/4264_1 /TAXON_ID=1104430 /ORGANISM="Chrysoreinhardia sp, Strain CCMP3193" /LENGTH=78 /DNA_ID=CAMNT_0006835415 /DNA_START=31 /DNA_END=267 /DNA_ORIENTATION=+
MAPSTTTSPEGRHSVKSFGLNVASTVLFVSPFVLYFNGKESALLVAAANAVVFLVAWFIPPRGWKRPHPYSDQAYLRR